MIAQFPSSTPISLGILDEFNTYVEHYLPYAEFNFVNLISWNRHNQGAVAFLNGNLVLRFPSYVDDSQFVTFLGKAKPTTTVNTLLSHAGTTWATAQLRLVPEPIAKRLKHSIFEIGEDDGNHDYVLSFPRLQAMQGHELHRFRRAIRTFSRLYETNTIFTRLDLSDQMVQKDVLDVFMRREMAKHNNDWSNELEALRQLFTYAPHCPLITYGLRIHGKLQAFMIAELVGRQWSVGQFWKADTRFAGIYSYLMFRVSEDLRHYGVSKMNIQQDLNITSLRFFKLSLGPSMHLKKYRVKRREAGVLETHDDQLGS